MPEPPTDNLYKFVAILGLTATLAGAAALVTQIEWVSRQFDPARPLTQRVADSLNTIADDLMSGRLGANQAGREKNADRLAATLPVLDSANALNSQAEAVTEARAWRVYAAGGAMVLGLILFLAGSYFWYQRHQRYLDAILKADAVSRGLTPPPPAVPTPSGPARKRRRRH